MRNLILGLLVVVSTSLAQSNFNEEMKKFLASEEGQQQIATALQTFARREQERAIQGQLDEQFKNPVKVDVGNSPVVGAKDAKVTVVEFSDFECPYCKRGAATMEQVLKAYPNDVRVVFKHRPLGFHQNARPASKAAWAAHQQGKFSEMKKALFDGQQSLGTPNFYEEAAKKIGLDLAKFKKDMESKEADEAIKADEAQADSLGVQGTPGFFVNGVSIQGAQPFPEFKRVIDRWLTQGK